jgi:hypothetical protein
VTTLAIIGAVLAAAPASFYLACLFWRTTPAEVFAGWRDIARWVVARRPLHLPSWAAARRLDQPRYVGKGRHRKPRRSVVVIPR